MFRLFETSGLFVLCLKYFLIRKQQNRGLLFLLQFLKIFHLLRFQEFVVAFLTPAMILSNVLFPAPFFPIRAIRSFSLIWKEMSLNRVVPPNSTVNPSTAIILFSSCSNFCFFKQLPRMPRSCRFRGLH